MSVTNEQVAALRPDALSPAETEAKAETIGCTKAAMPTARSFVAAILAGAFIAFGATFFCLFFGDATMPFAVRRVVGSMCFCLGLILVLCCGAELFTGNVLLLCAKGSGKLSWGQVLRNWGVVWLGNLVGALVIVCFVALSGTCDMNSGGMGDTFVTVAASKTTLSIVNMFFKGILCNILVCLAVWMGFAGRTIVDKVAAVLFPITAFVAIGFEHSIANMFFLPMGYIANFMGYGEPGAVLLSGLVLNLVVVTLGNIVGGGLVAYAYRYLYAPRS